MQLRSESRRARWAIMLATWTVCAALVWLHTSTVRDYVALLNEAGLRGSDNPRTPLQQVIPARYADAQMWARHVLAAKETGVARVRFTHADNAPHGREVHWSSAFAWLLRCGASAHEAITGTSGPHALERILLWFNAALLIVLVLLLSTWAARRAGAGAGIIVACGMIGHTRFYEGFQPVYVDHHGLVTAAVFGLLLGILFMGAGWWKPSNGAAGASRVLPVSPQEARRGAIISALWGAFGVWVSAAAVLPVIALTGAAALAVTWAAGRAAVREGAQFLPEVWRTWGRVGASACVVFYLIEYAPSHLSLRLEVNHPLYAFAWWGGAEIVASLGEWLVSRRRGTASRSVGAESGSATPPDPVLRSFRLILPLIAVLAPPAVMLLGGPKAFIIGDPFVGALRHFVAEGMSLPEAVRQSGAGRVMFDLGAALLLVVLALVLWRRRGDGRLVVNVLALVTAALIAMAFFEVRWWLNVSAAELGLLVTLVAVAGSGTHSRWRGMAGAAGLLLLMPAIHRIVRDRSENRQHVVAAGDLLQPLYRDIAAVVRESQPAGEIVLLANPNASTGISYFGRFQSLGTLFWENAPGLRAAAEIFSATTDDDAFALIRARKVTHIAMLSTVNFLGEYYRLLHPGSAPGHARKTFGYRLLEGQAPPAWLQPVPYRPPADLKDAAQTIRLFKVAPDQTPLERLFHFALAQLSFGEIEPAEKSLEAAAAHVPANARAEFYETAGAAFYDYGADAAAIRQFRRVLDLAYNPDVANTVAWILATTRDNALRDGRAALALVEPIVRENPNDATALSTYAAACAEVGRFADAISSAERAVAAVRASGDRTAAELLQRRLEAYRADRPWRQ